MLEEFIMEKAILMCLLLPNYQIKPIAIRRPKLHRALAVLSAVDLIF